MFVGGTALFVADGKGVSVDGTGTTVEYPTVLVDGTAVAEDGEVNAGIA